MMTVSKICPGCSAELADEARFCTKCGQMLEEETMPVLHKEDAGIDDYEKTMQGTPVSCYTSDQNVSIQPDLQQAALTNPEVSKEIVKSMKEQLKAAKKADRMARKSAKKAYYENGARKKTSVAGFIGAAVLSVFLAINLVLCFTLSLVLGLAGSDISNFAIGIGKDLLSIESLLESVEAFSNEDVRDLVEELIGEDTDLTLRAGGETYTVEFSEQTLGIIKNLALSDIGPAGMLADAIDEYMDVFSTLAILVIVYIVVNIVVLIVAIVSCLGMGKRGLIVPGIIFVLVGCITLMISIVGMMLPEIVSALGINSLFSLDFVATCTLTSSISTAMLGAVFCLVGVLGKNNN